MLKNIFCALLLLTGIFCSLAAEPLQWPQDHSGKVFFLPQFSAFESISDSGLNFFRQTLERAAQERAQAVILELDTPGGSVETAFKYLSLLEKAAMPVIVYLNPNGISAGMIIALGADRVAISPNGLIGDAMPISAGINGTRPITERPEKADPAGKTAPQVDKKSKSDKKPAAAEPGALEQIIKEIRKLREQPSTPGKQEDERLAEQKFLTVFFKMLQVLAEKNQRPVKVVRAMADPYTELDAAADGIEHKKKSPLTLSAKEAHQLKVVDMIASDRNDLLKQLGLEKSELVVVKRSAIEEIGAFLAAPALAGLLLVIGLVGIFVEVKTPGFGVPGVLGLAALTLFFLGHIASGASDWGPMVVFFVGLILIALEIFLIPGFGLIGIMGIGCVLLSFFWAFGWNNIETALQVVTVSLLLSIVIMVLLAVYVLPHTTLFKKVSLESSMESSDGWQAKQADSALIGSEGVTLTPLRPAGVISIDGKRLDAASEGDFMEAGEAVIVTARNGFQLVVRRKNV